MASILSSQGMVFATAMAVSGTVILLALRLQKSLPSSTPHFPILSPPPSPIISSSDHDVKKIEKKRKKKKKKKRVHFAEDVVDPIGNSDEYRKMHSSNNNNNNNNNKYCDSISLKPIKYLQKGGKAVQEMPANRVALYNGILRDRVQRLATSY